MLIDDSFVEVRNDFPVNATMSLYVMRDCVSKFDLFIAQRTRFSTSRWTTFYLLYRPLGNPRCPVRFVNCSLAMSIIFLLTVKAFLAGIALESTHARFEEFPCFAGAF